MIELQLAVQAKSMRGGFNGVMSWSDEHAHRCG